MGFAAVTGIPGFVGIISPLIGGYLIDRFGIEIGMRVLYAFTITGLTAMAVIYLRFLQETLIYREDRPSSVFRVIKGSYGRMMETIRRFQKELRLFSLILRISVFFNSLTSPYWVVYAADFLKLRRLAGERC